MKELYSSLRFFLACAIFVRIRGVSLVAWTCPSQPVAATLTTITNCFSHTFDAHLFAGG